MIIELIQNGIFNRGHFVTEASLKKGEIRDFECYTSVFSFEKDVIDYANDNISTRTGKPSIAGYVGKHTIRNLWIDVDCSSSEDIKENIKTSAEISKVVIERLMKNYGVSKDGILVLFSGNKGFHLGIPSNKFGAYDYYTEYSNKIAKNMVKIICSDISNIDYKVYDISRIFRMPFSKHQTSGLYKTPVSIDTLMTLDIDTILENAKTAKSDVGYPYNLSPVDGLVKLFSLASQQAQLTVDLYEETNSRENNFKNNKTIFKIPEMGNRNDAIYRMAFRLFCQHGLKVQEVSEIMRIIYEVTNHVSMLNKKEVMSDVEFRTLINSAYKSTRVVEKKQIKVSSIEDMTMNIYEKISNAKFIKTNVHEIDFDLDGGFEVGNMYSIIGKGGTIKSLILQNMVKLSCMSKESSGIYFNMEMSEKEFYERTFYSIFKTSLKEQIGEHQMTKEEASQAEAKLRLLFNNSFGVVNQNDLSPDEIREVVIKRESEIKGKISWIVIDSFNSLQLNGTETETCYKYTKQLKEIAKELQIVVIIINHANQGAIPHLRDVSQHVRGGTKTIDNCDAYFCMSKIIDKENSNFNSMPQDIIYLPNKFYMRFVNKRGSGNTINKIIEVNEERIPVFLEEDPYSYEVVSRV